MLILAMRWRKVLKVAIVVCVILFAVLFVPFWFAILRPPSINYRFLNNHSMVRHGLMGSMSNGPNHGWEWAVFTWKAPFDAVVSDAKAELTGWKTLYSDPSSKVKHIMFQDTTEHEIIIYSMDLPKNGEIFDSENGVPNLNSVVVLVTQALPDNQYEEIRSRNFRSEP